MQGSCRNPLQLGRPTLEKAIEKLEERKKTITLKFADAEITPDQIAEMSKEIAEVKSQIVEKEEEWFMLSEG